VVPPDDPIKKMWEGSSPSVTPIAKQIGATVIKSKEPVRTVRELLKGTDTVHTQALPGHSIPGTTSSTIRQEFASRQGETPRNTPSALGNADLLLSPMRLIKYPSEVAAIKTAGSLTGEILHAALPLITPGTKEHEIVALIDYYYRLCGGEPAFGTIVAAGVSAATLHYHDATRTLRKGDFLLIDTGIELDMYASDITRTIPVGEITEAQRTIYGAVLAAQKAAIKKVTHGALIRDIYLAAAKELTEGLKEVGILKGKTSALLGKGAYRPYFPHGIGHSLGIDVHDVGGLRGNQEARLLAGMVFTIEPGVYLPKATKHLPALGIRIEDDVLVKKKGCDVLTEKVFPKELDQVYDLFE
jgi:Xaa-Pro aminopeptidase